MPGSQLLFDPEKGTVALKSQPSWLMHSMSTLTTFMRIFYQETEWTQKRVASAELRGWFIKQEWQEESHKAMQ